MEPKVMPPHSMSVTEDGGQVVVEWLQDLMQETDQYCGLYEMYVYGGSYKKKSFTTEDDGEELDG